MDNYDYLEFLKSTKLRINRSKEQLINNELIKFGYSTSRWCGDIEETYLRLSWDHEIDEIRSIKEEIVRFIFNHLNTLPIIESLLLLIDLQINKLTDFFIESTE